MSQCLWYGGSGVARNLYWEFDWVLGWKSKNLLESFMHFDASYRLTPIYQLLQSLEHRCRSLTASARSAYKSTRVCRLMHKSMQFADRVTITSELCDRYITICRPVLLRQCHRLDYCNSLLHNISKKNIQKLQRIQNNLARVVLKAPRLTSPEPMLASLHWLPVVYRIQYKLAIITFKALTTGQPTYLADLLHRRVAVRYTRSSTPDSLVVPSFRTKIASHALSHAAPTIWNNSPYEPSGTTHLTKLEKRHQ